MSDEKNSIEFCEAEFERFAREMDLDFSADKMDAESRVDFARLKGIFINAMRDGHLIVNEKGEPVYTPKVEPRDPITFHEPRGSTYMAADSKKKDHDITKTFASMAEMTKQDVKRYANMPARDLKVCTALLQLFLG